VAARLFDVDVLARVQRQDRRGRVPVVRRGDKHGLDFAVIENLTQVLHRAGRCAGRRLDDFGGGAEPVLIDVAKSR
jgi:hypothetical protein